MPVTRESLRPLLELQRIDTAIDRLNVRRSDLPEQRTLDEVIEQRDALASSLAERREALAALVREQTKLEHEIGQLDDRAKADNQRLFSGDVGARELTNLQAELDALARRKTLLEDQELEIMEQREGVEAEVASMDERLGALEAKAAEATADRDRATVEIDKELGELSGARSQLVPTVEQEAVELYEDLRGKYRGVGVAALEKGTCRACGLPISPLARDEIKHSDDPWIRCENCRRLLVVV
ncbi:MAG TPA: hypothetical protein VGB83_04180 [Actinomycetota bacterium]